MHIDWLPEMRVGHARLDVERQCLLVAVNAAIAYANRQDANAIIPRLVVLHDMAAEYFAHEEEIMRAVGFPLVDFHAQEHLMLLRLLEARREIIGVLQKEQPLEPADIPNLPSFLRSWLTDHMLGKDWRLRQYLAARYAAEESVSRMTNVKISASYDS